MFRGNLLQPFVNKGRQANQKCL